MTNNDPPITKQKEFPAPPRTFEEDDFGKSRLNPMPLSFVRTQFRTLGCYWNLIIFIMAFLWLAKLEFGKIVFSFGFPLYFSQREGIFFGINFICAGLDFWMLKRRGLHQARGITLYNLSFGINLYLFFGIRMLWTNRIMFHFIRDIPLFDLLGFFGFIIFFIGMVGIEDFFHADTLDLIILAENKVLQEHQQQNLGRSIYTMIYGICINLFLISLMNLDSDSFSWIEFLFPIWIFGSFFLMGVFSNKLDDYEEQRRYHPRFGGLIDPAIDWGKNDLLVWRRLQYNYARKRSPGIGLQWTQMTSEEEAQWKQLQKIITQKSATELDILYLHDAVFKYWVDRLEDPVNSLLRDPLPKAYFLNQENATNSDHE